jgi:hypothetical protein
MRLRDASKRYRKSAPPSLNPHLGWSKTNCTTFSVFAPLAFGENITGLFHLGGFHAT